LEFDLEGIRLSLQKEEKEKFETKIVLGNLKDFSKRLANFPPPSDPSFFKALSSPYLMDLTKSLWTFSICRRDTFEGSEITEPIPRGEPTELAKHPRNGGRPQSEVAERHRARRTSLGWEVGGGAPVVIGVRKIVKNGCPFRTNFELFV
jgi:hypothetical protein